MSSTLPHSLEALLETAVNVDVPANTRHMLTEPGVVWFVGPVSGDVFAWEYENEQFIPFFLQEVSSGDLILGTAAENEILPEAFFFIASEPAMLYKVSQIALRACVNQDLEVRLWIVNKLEKWSGKLLSLFTASTPATGLIEFSIGSTCTLAANKRASLQLVLDPERKQRLAWIGCTTGEVTIEGNPALRLSSEKQLLYPLTFFLWIEALSDAQIVSYSTSEAIDKPEVWAGLLDLNRKLFHFIEHRKQQDIRLTKIKNAKKKNLEAESDHESILALGSLLEASLAYAPSHTGTPLYKACDLVGQAMKVKMVPPARMMGTLDNQVQEVAVASGLFHRQITLKSKWWEQAFYPIVGFYGENRKPVALINVTPTQFEFQDPETLQKGSINAENAHLFDPTAFVFYTPFLEKRIGFFNLMKFAYSEVSKESYIFIVLAILTGIVNLYLPYSMKALFDSLTATANISLLMQLTLGLVLAGVSLTVFAIAKNFALQRLSGFSSSKLQMGLWGRILNLPTSFFRKQTVGELINQFTSLVTVCSTISSSAIIAFFSVIYCLFYLLQMISFSPSLTLASLAGFAIPAFVYLVCSFFEVRLFKRIIDLSGIIQGFIIQIISGLSKIRVAGAESRFFKIWSHQFAEKKRLFLRLQKVQIFTHLTTTLFPTIATVIIYAYAITIFKKQTLAGKETLTTGAFVGFATAFGLFVSSGLEVLNTIFTGLKIVPLWKNASPLIEQPIEKSQEKEKAPPFQGKVAIDHVSYRYMAEEDLTLKDISIQALPGEFIAIIGPSGAGKSTLVRLLLGFEKPESGAVYFDDKDLDDFDPRSVRAQIGTILQNAALISGSIYENIVGNATYSDEAIDKAIHFSGFEDDLKLLPMGLDTMVSMGGGSFSGGQRQRLLLARALVANPKILLLDEATSALDNKTQDIVSNHLDRLRVTRIVIAHRLSTIKNADRIYVLERGEIVQVGTFKELAQQEGLFLSMLKRQML